MSSSVSPRQRDIGGKWLACDPKGLTVSRKAAFSVEC